MALTFTRRFDFDYCVPAQVAPGVRRVVARNPKDYTLFGTNTYVIGTDSLAVLDPGPDLDEHIDALMATIGGAVVSHIFVTHSHEDHSPAARRLSELTGAPVCGFGPLDEVARAQTYEDIDTEFDPDIRLGDGEVIAGAGWTLRALHTPGHFPNHLCYALDGRNILFSGDQVMAWATTVISPPLGHVGQYLASLARLAAYDFDRYLPSHGPEVAEPARHVRELIDHRHERERQIIGCLAQGIADPAVMVERLYEGLTPRLVLAARQSVRAHLIHLQERGLICRENRLRDADPHFIDPKFVAQRG